MKTLLLVILLPLLSFGAAFAINPLVQTLNDGNLTLFVLNNGSFGFDPQETRGDVTGLYYPGNSYKGIMTGGGIWVAGKKNDEWRITISGDESEFVPGPIGSDGMAADTTFRLYKITRGENYALSDDYRNWPVALGAPVDAFGRPLIRGSQALFTIFNDADTVAHTFTGFAGTLPLGVQVRCYAHTWDNDLQLYDTMLTQVVFLDYVISNVGDDPIDSCIISIFADPNIGYSDDDRLGSQGELQCAYIYDEDDSDPYYGNLPPVVGMTFLDNTATSMNYYYRCKFSYPECEAVDTLPKLLHIIRGLRPGGEPYIDPTTQQPTAFPFGGNLADSTGWIDTLSRDYRFILNTAPIDLAAGDSIRLKAALIVAQGSSSKDGVSRFLETVSKLRGLEDSDTLEPAISISRINVVDVHGRAVIGHDWGGRYLGGGADLASRYLPYAAPRPAANVVELLLGSKSGQNLARFVENGARLAYAGEISNTGIVLRSAGRNLQCVVLDLDQDGKITDKDGKLDPLILTGLKYEDNSFGSIGTNLSSLADELQFVVHLDQTPEEIGVTSIKLNAERMNEPFSALSKSITVSEPTSEAPTEIAIEIANHTDFVQSLNLISSSPDKIGFTPTAFDLGVGESRYVSMQSTATYDSTGELAVSMHSSGFEDDQRTIPVNVLAAQVTVSGDADNSGKFELLDLLAMIRILYFDDPIITPLRQIDANCDLRFGLVDVVAYINFLYQHFELPCQSIAH